MSRFQKAVEKVLQHEGGYVNRTDDPGGETKYGISKRTYPELNIRELTKEQAAEIYERDWWNLYGYERILDEALSIKLFDLVVNMGASRAHRFLQESLNDCGCSLAVDGILGPRTIVECNSQSGRDVLKALLKRADAYYHSLNKPQFLAGWLNRLYDV